MKTWTSVTLLSSASCYPDTDLICSNSGGGGGGWGSFVLIKSLINYLVDQKFSVPLLLRASTLVKTPQIKRTPQRKDSQQQRANTGATDPRALTATHTLSNTHTHVHFDEAKLEYNGGGWVAGVQLVNNLVYGRLCLPPSVGS